MVNSGIYKIISFIDGKIYIGSAVNLDRRKYEHFITMKKNIHRNKILQNTFNKYGSENFIFEIIEEVEDIKLLIAREQYYLDTLLFAQEFILNKDKRFKTLGFNINPTAGNSLGRKMSDEAKRKMSLSKQGIVFTPEIILQRSSKLKNRTYSQESILNMKKGIENMSEKDKLLRRKKLSLAAQNRTPETINKIAKARQKPVNQYDLNNQFIKEWESAQIAGNTLSISKMCIGNCCLNKQKTSGGFLWKFKKLTKK